MAMFLLHILQFFENTLQYIPAKPFQLIRPPAARFFQTWQEDHLFLIVKCQVYENLIHCSSEYEVLLMAGIYTAEQTKLNCVFYAHNEPWKGP